MAVVALYHTHRHSTLGRTPLDEGSVRRRKLYLTTHNTHKRRIRAPGGIRTRNLSLRAAEDPHLRSPARWDRLLLPTNAYGDLTCAVLASCWSVLSMSG